MDRNYFYHKHVQERQKEISKELATRHLLRETGQEGEQAQAGKSLRTVWQAVPVAIFIGILKVFRLVG
jgi:hypothetical protein